MENFDEIEQLKCKGGARYESVSSMEYSGNDAMQKLLKGDIVRGIDKVEVEALGSDFYKLRKLTK